MGNHGQVRVSHMLYWSSCGLASCQFFVFFVPDGWRRETLLGLGGNGNKILILLNKEVQTGYPEHYIFH